MPDRDSEGPQNARLLTVLIWAGVGLAPVAALVALLGGSENSIRFAVLLVAVCVVLIGAALLIRNDPVLLKMDVEDQVEALRAELREEIAAGARATGQRVKALQDEMTRMRAAGSPAMALPPAGARVAGAAAPVGTARPEAGHPTGGRAAVAAPVPAEPGHATGGRASAAVPSRPATGPVRAGGRVPEAGRESGPVRAGGRVPEAGREAGRVAGGRPVVAAASVAPVVGSTAVARVPGAAASAPVAVAPMGSASVAAAPRQRGAAAVPPASGGGYQAGYGDAPAPAGSPAVSGYGPGSSGSAWAERGAAAEYDAAGEYGAASEYGEYGAAAEYDAAGGGYAGEPAAEQRPSRRHAAPDTGTDLARYGLSDPAAAEEQGYDTGYDAHDGYDQTGDYDYAEPEDQPGTGGFGVGTSAFFAQDASGGFLLDNEYPQPDDQGEAVDYGYAENADPAQSNTYGRPTGGYGRDEQYGPDPMADQHGWAPRSREQRGRW